MGFVKALLNLSGYNHEMFIDRPHSKLYNLAREAVGKSLGISPPFEDELSKKWHMNQERFGYLCASVQEMVFHRIVAQLAGCEPVTERCSGAGPNRIGDFLRPNLYSCMKRFDGSNTSVEAFRKSMPEIESYRTKIMQGVDEVLDGLFTAECLKADAAHNTNDPYVSRFDISAVAKRVIKEAWGIDANRLENNPMELTEQDMHDYGRSDKDENAFRLPNLLAEVKYIIASKLVQDMEPFWIEDNHLVSELKDSIRRRLYQALGIPKTALGQIKLNFKSMSEEEAEHIMKVLEDQCERGEIHPGTSQELEKIYELAKPDIVLAVDKLDQAIDRVIEKTPVLALYQRKQQTRSQAQGA